MVLTHKQSITPITRSRYTRQVLLQSFYEHYFLLLAPFREKEDKMLPNTCFT